MRIPRPGRTRLLVVALLLLGHLVSWGLLGYWGLAEPFELFNLLLLLANFAIAGILLTSTRSLLLGAGTMFLVAAHAALGQRLAPDALTSGAILLVNILVLYVGVQVNVHLPTCYWYAFVVSYFALFYIFVIALRNAEALFLLFLLGLTACVRSFRLLAYFWCLTLSFTFCQPYAWPAAVISFLILTALFGARGPVPSPLFKVFLGCGLVLVLLVLLPVILVAMGEEVHSIVQVLRDARIRAAIRTTLITASLSTTFLAVATIPLAYALTRLRFPGKSLFLSLVNLPIVIPQSVAGIALIQVFGRQQFLGNVLDNWLGVQFDGTMLGICLAQVFVALPFIMRNALAAFEAVPVGLELSARTLGASSWGVFWRVAMPLASRGLFLGAVLAWARAAGEFGAVLFIAPTPETAPIAAYNRFHSVGIIESGPLVAALLLFSLAMFFLLQWGAQMLPSVHGLPESRSATVP